MNHRLPILWHYACARRRAVRWRDRENLERWQEARVRRHLVRICDRSAFFGRLARELGVDRWRKWPLLDKSAMMAHFDEWNTAAVRLDEAWPMAVEAEKTRDFSTTLRGITVGMSSGTSGSRGLFLANARERRLWAAMLLARTLRGTLLREHRAALFLRADSPLYRTVGSRRFRFAFFDLMEPLERLVPRLVDLRPTVLAAPPGVLARLATLPDAHSMLAPPAILLSVADVLDDCDRSTIESGFQRPLGQVYQATEGFLAATCPHGRMHWNEDTVVIEKEWLDDEKRRFIPIITDFRRQTQPIVRYRLDDVIVDGANTKCPCGSVFGILDAIEGRSDDTLRLARATGFGEVPVFSDFVRRAIIMALPSGSEYSVRQTSLDRWSVSLHPASPEAAVRAAIHDLAMRLDARPPELEFVPWIPQPLHSKRRRVRCDIPAQTAP